MGARSWRLVFLSLCIFFNSGLGRTVMLRDEDREISSFEFSSQLDSVPIVNPTTPGTANPYPPLNPTTPQAPDTTGQTPTTPYMTPTSPNTNPTTPTNPYTTPTNPYTTPTTTPPASPSANPTTPTTTPPTPTSGGGGGGGGFGGGGGGFGGGGGGGQWCVASESAQEKALKVALDYACGYGADCSGIQPGASCYNPNTLRDHASYAFNDYYQKNPAPTSCAFGGTATLTNKDPSNGSCHFSSSKTPTPSMSPPTYVSPPNTLSPPTAAGTMTPTPPTTMTPTPPGMTIPGGASVYGTGPTGSPNMATSASHSLLLLITSFGLLASLHAESYI